jgi:hypothetical protein
MVCEFLGCEILAHGTLSVGKGLSHKRRFAAHPVMG